MNHVSLTSVWKLKIHLAFDAAVLSRDLGPLQLTYNLNSSNVGFTDLAVLLPFWVGPEKSVRSGTKK